MINDKFYFDSPSDEYPTPKGKIRIDITPWKDGKPEIIHDEKEESLLDLPNLPPIPGLSLEPCKKTPPTRPAKKNLCVILSSVDINESVHALELSSRIEKKLLAANINTIGQLAQFTVEGLLTVPKIGYEGARECEYKLSRAGLCLGMKFHPDSLL